MSEITTPFDDLPIKVRRENWGWFGEPWWSFAQMEEFRPIDKASM